MTAANLWKRYQQYLCQVPSLGLTLDVSRMRFEDDFVDRMAAHMERALKSMDALERGAIANPDENRMVGHYWLRAPDLAPFSGSGRLTGTLKEQGHGAFTYYFLKGLDGAAADDSGVVTPRALYNYLKPKVQDAASRQNRDQTPIMDGATADAIVRYSGLSHE